MQVGKAQVGTEQVGIAQVGVAQLGTAQASMVAAANLGPGYPQPRLEAPALPYVLRSFNLELALL